MAAPGALNQNKKNKRNSPATPATDHNIRSWKTTLIFTIFFFLISRLTSKIFVKTQIFFLTLTQIDFLKSFQFLLNNFFEKRKLVF